MAELDEFFSYIEAPQVGENWKAWIGSYPEGEGWSTIPVPSVSSTFVDWTTSPASKRKTHVNLLLESLEHKDAVIRFTNARRLFYVVQGALTI